MDYKEINTGLWEKESKNGNKYFGGKIEINEAGSYRLTLFQNNKTNEKQPDYRIILSKAEQEQKSVESISTDDIEILDSELPF